MAIVITPLDAPLGAKVQGIDVQRPPSDTERDALQAALDEHLVLILPDWSRTSSPEEVVRFCHAFGKLRPTIADKSRLPEHPAINLVSNRTIEGTEGTGGNGLVEWHSDVHFEPPPIETIYLDALAVTSWGGDTRWTNLCAAYDALDPKMQDRIEGLNIRCRFRNDLDFGGYFKASEALDEQRQAMELGLVQRNVRTGRKSLWPTPGPALYEVDVVGMPLDEGQALVEELYVHCTQERFTYTHHWRTGDAVMWANTQTLHQRKPFPADEERVLRHVNILRSAEDISRQST